MSDIEKTISLKGAEKVVADYQRLQSEVEKLKEQTKGLRIESERDPNAAVSHIRSMAAEYLSLGSAIGVATAAIAANAAEQDRVGKIYDDYNSKITHQIALSNDLKHANEIDKWAKGTENPMKAISALSGVREGDPNLDFKRRKELSTEMMAVADYVKEEQLTEVGRTVGKFQKIGFDTPVDTALTAHRMLGGDSSQLNSGKFSRALHEMVTSGVDRELALAINTAAADAELGPKFGTAMVDAITSTEKPSATNSPAKNKFLALDQSRRAESLLNDPKSAKEMLGGRGNVDLEIIRGSVRRLEREYELAPGESQRLVANARASDAGREARESSRTKGITDTTDLIKGEEVDDWNAVRTINEEMYKYRMGRGGFFNIARTWLGGKVDAVGTELAVSAKMSPRAQVQGEYDILVDQGRAKEADHLRKLAEGQGILIEIAKRQEAREQEQQQETRIQMPVSASRSIHGE